MQKKPCDKFFDKHGLNFNHLHANNNNDDELKKFYRTFIVYRLFLDNLDIWSLQYASKTVVHVNQKKIAEIFSK